MTFGQLSQFLLYAGYMGIAAASLSEMWGEVQRAAGAMERLVELARGRADDQGAAAAARAAATAAAAASSSSTCGSAIRRAPRARRSTTSR